MPRHEASPGRMHAGFQHYHNSHLASDAFSYPILCVKSDNFRLGYTFRDEARYFTTRGNPQPE